MTDFTPDLGTNSLPPQNIEAEEIILGGLLFDPNAMSKVVDILPAEAFYVQAHRHIYEAAIALYSQGQPIDLMTVGTWLKDHDLSERSGGTPKLVSLLDKTVSAANIERYVPLITKKYIRRLLISTAKEISELGYDTSKDLDQVLDLAEQKIFSLTQARVLQGLVPLSTILVDTFTEIQNFQDELALPGISSGFYDLDGFTTGFQRSDLIIIAGRPAMGKTSFALNIATNIAKQQKMAVAIFSLEMSKEQLAMRLLSSEGEVASNRLKSGKATQEEMQPLMHAMGILSELPIYIDDTGNITVMQIRSEVRRLQAEKKGNLGLVLLDYLQLMQSTDDTNRVQELSKITRSLKILAREVNAPIIALSQLSRGVEQRTNKRPILSDLRESGCVSGDTIVSLADTGAQVPIKDLVGKSGFLVWALNEATMKIEKAVVSNAFATGIKAVYSLTTNLGRKVKATANHKFLTIHGWKPLDELKEGEYLALPRYIPCSSLHTNKNLIPREFWTTKIKTAQTQLAISNHQLQESLGNRYSDTSFSKNNINRDHLPQPAKILPLETIDNLANGDIYWDKIKEIKFAGEEEVYDLTVPVLENFVANMLYIHNSIEQDADLVLMLYRDEYYNSNSPDQGVAEVIIAKHRNGPTGQAKLIFRPEYTKFFNMKRSYD